MPTYLYRDEKKHEQELTLKFSELDNPVYCPKCKAVMHRVPQGFAVNWNGLPPHLEHTRPMEISNYVKTADTRTRYWKDGGKEKFTELQRNGLV